MLRKKGQVSTLKCQPRKEIPGKLIMKQRWFSSAELCALNCTFMWFLGQFATFLAPLHHFPSATERRRRAAMTYCCRSNNVGGSGSPSLCVWFHNGYLIFLSRSGRFGGTFSLPPSISLLLPVSKFPSEIFYLQTLGTAGFPLYLLCIMAAHREGANSLIKKWRFWGPEKSCDLPSPMQILSAKAWNGIRVDYALRWGEQLIAEWNWRGL